VLQLACAGRPSECYIDRPNTPLAQGAQQLVAVTRSAVVSTLLGRVAADSPKRYKLGREVDERSCCLFAHLVTDAF
jgi:hypothetical protein